VLAGPVLIVRGGRFAIPSPDRWELEPHVASMERTLQSVGNVFISVGGYRSTGFVAGRGMIVVPAYLVREVAARDRSGHWTLKGAVSIDFGDRVAAESPRRFPVTGVAWMDDRDETMGVAVLRVAEKSLAGDPLPPPLTLAQGLPVAAGQKMYLVGYPARDARLDDLFAQSVYGGVYDVKRVSCGRMLALSDLQVVHDCFTAPGSSGAPVIDLESGQVVGIHLINSPGEGRIALNIASPLSRPFLAALGLNPVAQAAQ
jgi:V8-like Glu-specific endopeptidase